MVSVEESNCCGDERVTSSVGVVYPRSEATPMGQELVLVVIISAFKHCCADTHVVSRNTDTGHRHGVFCGKELDPHCVHLEDTATSTRATAI